MLFVLADTGQSATRGYEIHHMLSRRAMPTAGWPSKKKELSLNSSAALSTDPGAWPEMPAVQSAAKNNTPHQASS